MHPPVDGSAGGGGTGAGGCGAGAGTPTASGESGGTHPPFTQTQFEAGLMLVQVLGAGATGTVGTLGAGGAGAGAGAMPASGCPGGSQPPPTHTQPGAGEALRHAPDGASAGGSEGCTPPAGGSHAPFTHVHPDPGEGPTQPAGPAAGRVTVAAVTNVKISEELVNDGLTSVA